jgi:branched-chain amino acid transport system substrate-binding protein
MADFVRARALAVLVASMALASCTDSEQPDDRDAGNVKTLIISSDLPMQGSSKDSSVATNQAIRLYLEQQGNKAGDYAIEFKEYDNSTEAAGSWDEARCKKNAAEHVALKNEVAVMGTFNSGCAKLEVPILNEGTNGPMLMVSHANTNPGLTKAWDAGEPNKYYPNGSRSYARVVTTDDYQGAAAARFIAQDLRLKKCYVLKANETYGLGLAKSFAKEARRQGIRVVGNEPWDAKAANYTALFGKVKSSGADCVYLSGNYDLNGGQLIKDKVAVLGANSKVKLMAPDGFTGYTELLKLKESEGMYLTFAGLTTQQLRENGGAGSDLLDAYAAKYGADPSTNYALYGVSAVQVIMEAIKKSDGTRKGVSAAVFSAGGITIPEAESVLGKEIKIDPETGDVNAIDISVEIIDHGVETFFKVQPVE